jgi:F420-dependent oxidoreductase-like protein
MRLDMQIPRFSWAHERIERRLTDIGRAAEDSGFRAIWVMDHFFQIPSLGEVTEPMLEAYTTLSFMAAATRSVRLGTLVTGVTYRWPGVLLKEVTTLDVLSGGRAMFGIGAAWFEGEHIGLGVPFPPLKQRFEMLEETLQIAQRMWQGDTRPFAGRHYTLLEPLNSPPAVSQPHPPILIGGGGEKRTLRLVARYADTCNLMGHLPANELAHKLDLLRQYCQQEGREYESIERTVLIPVERFAAGHDDRVLLDRLELLAKLGFNTAIVSLRDVETPVQTIEAIGREITPRARELGPSVTPHRAAA